MTEYVVIYERGGGGGWSAYLPDIDGVVAAAQTRAEVEELMVEAFNAYLEYMRDQGKPIPRPISEAGRIATQATAPTPAA